MIQINYGEGQLVRCINRTKENHEKLTLDKVYVMCGASVINGTVIYAVKDEAGNMFYSIDRFEDVRKPTAEFQDWDTMKKECEEKAMKEKQIKEEQEKMDMVNNPNHYTFGGIETIDFLEAKLGIDGFRGWLKGNILKYMARATVKGKELEDYKKAQFYLNKLIAGMGDVEDEAVNRPVTKKQSQYIAGLTTQLSLDRTNLPSYLSPLEDYHDLSEAEAIQLIDRLLAIKNYMEDTK